MTQKTFHRKQKHGAAIKSTDIQQNNTLKTLRWCDSGKLCNIDSSLSHRMEQHQWKTCAPHPSFWARPRGTIHRMQACQFYVMPVPPVKTTDMPAVKRAESKTVHSGLKVVPVSQIWRNVICQKDIRWDACNTQKPSQIIFDTFTGADWGCAALVRIISFRRLHSVYACHFGKCVECEPLVVTFYYASKFTFLHNPTPSTQIKTLPPTWLISHQLKNTCTTEEGDLRDIALSKWRGCTAVVAALAILYGE